MNFAVFYLFFISVTAFLIFSADKVQAKRNLSRISESILFIVTLFGGTAGAILGMLIFRHKISKTSFILKIIAIIIFQILFYIYFLRKV